MRLCVLYSILHKVHSPLGFWKVLRCIALVYSFQHFPIVYDLFLVPLQQGKTAIAVATVAG